MNRIKKAAGANGGKTRERVLRKSRYVTNCTPAKPHLSSLIDQAISRFEAHNDLARYHAAEAQKHRQILSSLQRLIPQNFTRPGGAA